MLQFMASQIPSGASHTQGGSYSDGRHHSCHLRGDKRHLLASGGLFHSCSLALTFFREMASLGNVVGEKLFSRETNAVG